jgi:hypothetical protein
MINCLSTPPGDRNVVRFFCGPSWGCRLLVLMLFVLALCCAAPVSWRGTAAQSATPASFQGNPCLDGSAQAAAAITSADSPVYDYVILLDVSGSMEGWLDAGGRDLSKRIMPAVKDSLKRYLRELPPDSQVRIIPFAGEIYDAEVMTFTTGDASGSENGLAEAETYIDEIVADNLGTHITDAISYGLDQLAKSRSDNRQHIQTMLLFTDGQGNGETDVDADGDFIVDNLLDAIGEYKREQPFLFVKYVSLGVEVPDAEEMERRGVDVVETVDGVPPVREVRVAISPDQLSELKPGVAATNFLCATSGDLGDGVEVVVSDDPAELPADVQVAFRSEGNTLTAGGLPLTYTLASTPSSGLGPYTTYVEVRSADPEVLINPGRLPVTFTVADPTPAVTLNVGEFPSMSRTRGVDDGDIVFTLPVDFTAPDGGAAKLSLNTIDLTEIAPGATVSFVAGGEDLGDTATLSAEQPAVELSLVVPSTALDAMADGPHTLPVEMVVTPRAADVTITGADTTQAPGGGQRVALGASLTLAPEPVCGVEVAPVPGQVLLEGDQSQEAVRWETTVTLTGRDGCIGTLAFDDSALQQAIPGARAAFDVNGDSPLQINLGDTPARVVLVTTAPRSSVLALGVGEHPQTIDLVATTIGRISPPEDLTPDETGTYAIPVTLPLVIHDRPGVTCTLPSFESDEIIADGSQEPSIERTGEVVCNFAGDVSVRLRVANQEDGVTATLSTANSAHGRTVTLDQDHPSATLALTVDRSAPQTAGEGTHSYTAQIEAQVSSHDATLELDGQPAESGRAISSNVEVQVRVVGEKVITIGPIELTPDPLEISTFDDEPDPLEWRGEIDVTLSNGADGTLQIDLPADSPVSAFLMVGETRLSGPAQLAGQNGPLELVVQLPLATAKTHQPGSESFYIPLTLNPQGARVEAPDFARDGELYRDTERVSLLVISPPVADLPEFSLPPGNASTSDDADDPVLLESAPIPFDLKNGAQARITVDDKTLVGAYPGASAGLVAGSGKPQPSIIVEQDSEPVTLVVLIPRDVLTDQGPASEPVISLTMEAMGDDTIVTKGGTPVPGGHAATVKIIPELVVSTPKFTFDVGEWRPDVLRVRADSSGTGELRWERTLALGNREEGANPAITVSPGYPAFTVRLYDGEVSEQTLLAEGQPGQAVTAAFAPDQERIIVVVSVPEDALRTLGLSSRSSIPGLGSSERHSIDNTITIDPRGSEGSISSRESAFREPVTLEEPLTVEIYEPRNKLIYVVPVLLLLLIAVTWALWPALPKEAAVVVNGDTANPVHIASGDLIGPGLSVDVQSNGVFGEIRGTPGGRFSGKAKFITGNLPIDYQGQMLNPGESLVIDRHDDLIDPDSGTQITYI